MGLSTSSDEKDTLLGSHSASRVDLKSATTTARAYQYSHTSSTETASPGAALLVVCGLLGVAVAFAVEVADGVELGFGRASVAAASSAAWTF
jgi:hypothetical protein